MSHLWFIYIYWRPAWLNGKLTCREVWSRGFESVFLIKAGYCCLVYFFFLSAPTKWGLEMGWLFFYLRESVGQTCVTYVSSRDNLMSLFWIRNSRDLFHPMFLLRQSNNTYAQELLQLRFLCWKVGGRLRCIGSPQHLKTRFGNHLELEVTWMTYLWLFLLFRLKHLHISIYWFPFTGETYWSELWGLGNTL